MKQVIGILLLYWIALFIEPANSDQSPPCSFHWQVWTPWTICDEDGLMLRQRSCVCEDNRTTIQSWWCSGSQNELDNLQIAVCNNSGVDMFNESVHLTYPLNGPLLSSVENTGEDAGDVDDGDADADETEEAEEEQSDEDSDINNPCRWKWDKWSVCTKPCGGGNTSRNSFCLCPSGVIRRCPGSFRSNETVPCNTHLCGTLKAHSKTYWIEQHAMYFLAKTQSNYSNLSWPFPNPLFNCSDEDPHHPKSNRHLMDILHEIVGPYTFNTEWTILAKEYAASLLNLYNGYVPSPDGEQAINQASALLANCTGYVAEELRYVYASKEKLNRLNNNIGGLDMVDADFEISNPIQEQHQQIQSSNKPQLAFIVIGVSVAFFVVLGIVVFISVYCYCARRKSYQVMKEEESDEENDIEENIPPTPTPLNLPRVAERPGDDIDESTGEE